MNFEKIILLTGAGFTANYGGFLSREMWSKIFNHSDLNLAGDIKLALRDNFDFERVYSDVFDDRKKYPDAEVKLFVSALNNAYTSQEESIDEFAFVGPSDIYDFLKSISNNQEAVNGMCFTLNQDLFFEKRMCWQPFGPSSIQYEKDVRGHLSTEVLRTVPEQSEIDAFLSAGPRDFCFVKLHGSVNWVTKDGGDCKVLGINKPETSSKIPLLAWYFDLFRKEIKDNNVELIIVGYSFNDEHINECIYEAVREPINNLRLYIINPEDPLAFYKRFIYKENIYSMNTPGFIREADPKRVEIWRAVKGYFPYKLSDIFSVYAGSGAKKEEFLQAVGITPN